MRRKDREITDFEQIRSMIDGCEVLRLGLADPEDPQFPYIVPVNFGYTVEEGQLRFYLHGATAGRKFELMQRMGVCSFEMDCDGFLDPVPEARDITTRYKSVMGKAVLRLLSGEEAEKAVSVIVDRFDVTRGFNWNRDVLPRTAVWELTVTELTAKENKPRA